MIAVLQTVNCGVDKRQYSQTSGRSRGVYPVPGPHPPKARSCSCTCSGQGQEKYIGKISSGVWHTNHATFWPTRKSFLAALALYYFPGIFDVMKSSFGAPIRSCKCNISQSAFSSNVDQLSGFRRRRLCRLDLENSRPTLSTCDTLVCIVNSVTVVE